MYYYNLSKTDELGLNNNEIKTHKKKVFLDNKCMFVFIDFLTMAVIKDFLASKISKVTR